MDTHYRPTWVEISLDALHHNIRVMKAGLPEDCLLMATVKANAYGHGAIGMAHAAERFGVDFFGVAFLDEALQLRKAGIGAPILVLGYVPAEGLEQARLNNISICLYREETIEAASKLPQAFDGQKLKVHVKIDSGMGRLGVIGTDEAVSFIRKAQNTSQIEVEGMFTHYAKADEADKSYTNLQYDRFNQVVEAVKQEGWTIPIIHAANSAAGIDTPEWAVGMVRFGIGMYGLYPSTEVDNEQMKLKPILSLKTKLVHVKQTPSNWGISYGTRYITAAEEQIGTLPIGYADGFSRMLSGKAFGLIRGVKMPIRGSICMDQCMIALDSEQLGAAGKPIEIGEEVVLIGQQGNDSISVEDLAEQIGTINYELVCMLTTRLPRYYTEAGQIIDIQNAIQ